MQILEVATGKLHTMLQTPANQPGQYEPIKWRDNTSLYLAFEPGEIGAMSPKPPLTGLYLLQDITKDQSQQSDNLQQIAISSTVINSSWQDFDISLDNTQVITSYCDMVKGAVAPQIITAGPSPINLQAVTNGSPQTIYQDQTNAITYTLSNSTLLFTIDNYVWGNDPNNPASPPSVDQNGLWKINTDGSGKMRIVTTKDGEVIQLNELGYTAWDNISRDNKQYAFVVRSTKGATTFSLLFGSLDGGASRSVETVSGTDYSTMVLVGWTTR